MLGMISLSDKKTCWGSAKNKFHVAWPKTYIMFVEESTLQPDRENENMGLETLFFAGSISSTFPVSMTVYDPSNKHHIILVNKH